MSDQILEELKLLRQAITTLVGTTDLPKSQQFSAGAVTKAAKAYEKMAIERGDWLSEDKAEKILGGAWNTRLFIIKEFDFKAYIKMAHKYHLNKKAVLDLAKELKKRNVDLKRYMEYKQTETEFQKKVANVKGFLKGKASFALPVDLKEVPSSDLPAPPITLITEEIDRLKKEFFAAEMAEYIDIYKDNFAMFKGGYHFKKYLKGDKKRICKKWCDDFNHANHTLMLLNEKPDKFLPVKEDDMIQL